MKIKKLSWFVLLICVVCLCFGCAKSEEKAVVEEKAAPAASETVKNDDPFAEHMDIEVAFVWRGREAQKPIPGLDLVGPYIEEHFNTTLDIIYTSESEYETLNVMFAGGDVSDVINLPFWGGDDGCTVTIKKAAEEDMIVPMDDYLAKYAPSLIEKLDGNYAVDAHEFELGSAEFGGKHYLMPLMTKSDFAQAYVNGINVPVVRKDILDTLGVKAEDIRSSADLKDLLVKIKEHGFQDINGKPIIPSAILGGSGFDLFGTSYQRSSKSGTFYLGEDGLANFDLFDPNIEKQLLFYNELYNEDLLYKESFNPGNDVKSKLVSTGAIGVIGWNGKDVFQRASSGLYVTNPEMEYVPLGYMVNADGDYGTSRTMIIEGYDGSPVMCFSAAADEAKIERFLRIMDFFNTREGKLLMSYGVEGETYKMVDGQPQFIGEYADLAANDPVKLAGYGIGEMSIYALNFWTCDNMEFYPAELAQLKAANHPGVVYADQVPVQFVSGYRLDKLANEFDPDQLKVVNTFMSDFRQVRDRVIAAPSKTEAKNILDTFMKSVKASDEVQAYLEYGRSVVEANKDKKIIY